MELTDEQVQVFDAAMTGQSFFLTGNAGTGKSYVLNQIIEAFKDQKENVYVTAPTGIAAVNVHGATVHSLLGITPSTNLLVPVDNDHRLKALQLFDEDHHILIMDEVSMCSVELFAYLMQMINYAEKYYHFDMQIILVGDFSQLPPVYENEAVPIIKQKFGGLFAFDSNYWDGRHLQTFVLSKIIRQDNPAFTKALNQIRIGDSQGIHYINQNCAKKPQDKAITLTGTNKIASRINSSRLSEIEGITFRFVGERSSKFSQHAMPTDEELSLKIGARVMIVANTSGAFNGEMGTVEGIVLDRQSYEDDKKVKSADDLARYRYLAKKAKQAWQKSKDKRILVQAQLASQLIAMAHNRRIEEKSSQDKVISVVYPMDDVEVYVRSDEDHELKVFGWHQWTSYKYAKEGRRIKKQIAGTFVQLPLRLGYAITIHKSQGQTFTRCNLSPRIFADGQLYVALSRVTDVHNLYLTYPITKDMVKASKEVISFYQWMLTKKGIGSLGIEKPSVDVKEISIKSDRVKLITWLNQLDTDQFKIAQNLLRNALKLQK